MDNEIECNFIVFEQLDFFDKICVDSILLKCGTQDEIYADGSFFYFNYKRDK